MTTTPISENAMEGLIQHLMRTFNLSRERAEKRAEWITKKNAERAAAKKVRLQQAQGLLAFDGLPDEEPISQFEQDPNIPF